MLDVRHLEMVEAIAIAGTVTGAARRLHLTQPALSHALASLEKRLGVPLFHRHPRGMAITPEGERVLSTARAVLQEIRTAEADLRRMGDGSHGTITVATECYTCYHWLPAVLGHFRTRFPGVDVHVAGDAAADPVAGLLDGRVDVAIVHRSVAHAELLSEPLFTDELVAVLPADHALARRPRVEPADFHDETLILHSRPEESAVVVDFLEPAGVRPARVLTLQLTDAVLSSVAAGLGVTVMATWALESRAGDAGLAVVPLAPDGLFREWRLLTRRDRAHRAAIQELARLFKESEIVAPT